MTAYSNNCITYSDDLLKNQTQKVKFPVQTFLLAYAICIANCNSLCDIQKYLSCTNTSAYSDTSVYISASVQL